MILSAFNSPVEDVRSTKKLDCFLPPPPPGLENALGELVCFCASVVSRVSFISAELLDWANQGDNPWLAAPGPLSGCLCAPGYNGNKVERRSVQLPSREPAPAPAPAFAWRSPVRGVTTPAVPKLSRRINTSVEVGGGGGEIGTPERFWCSRPAQL